MSEDLNWEADKKVNTNLEEAQRLKKEDDAKKDQERIETEKKRQQ